MTEAERRERARGIAVDVQAYLRAHEIAHHDGDPCFDERINFVAYLCHKIGIHLDPRCSDGSLAAFRMMVERAADYDAIHDEHIVGPS